MHDIATPEPARAPEPAASTARLGEVVRVFARLGATAFGGPAAHVALFEAECVARRRWCDRARFLRLLALANLLPGPTSTELALELGRARAGWPGLVLGGLAWILPGTLLVLALAALYVQLGSLPATAPVLASVRPVVLVVLADALARLARDAVPDRVHALWAMAGLACAIGGVAEPVIVLAALAAGLALARGGGSRLAVVPVAELFSVFLVIGATLFGSGYVLVAYLEDALPPRGWLDRAQVLDAIAVGQVTPGPLFSTAAFVGYLLAGVPGAAAATVGIFLPCFGFVALAGPLLERVEGDPRLRRALGVVNAVVVGCIAAVVVLLVPSTLTGPYTIALGAVAALAVLGLGVAPPTAMLAAAAAGLVRAWLGSTGGG